MNKGMQFTVMVVSAVLGLSAWAAEPFAIERGKVPAIVIEGEMRPFVAKAAADVATDIERIFGTRPIAQDGRVALPRDRQPNRIVLKKGGSGFENYTLESKPGNVLEITGSDDRGVMFGLYRFASDYLKVDPFWWFARLADGTSPSHAPRQEMKWKSISLKQGAPSFKYRGWFINDEDFLNGFMPEENGHRKINYARYHVCFGPTIADRIYEAAVRSGYNTMICASYVDILNPDEKRLIDIASGRGLYITMHHQEPVGAGGLQLDLHFPEIRGTTYASHPDLWRKAWQQYVTAWCEYPDVIFQVGLRGRGDTPFWQGAKMPPGLSGDELLKFQAGLISQAMTEQVEMIKKTAKHHYRLATQLWMEGAELQRKGLLKFPEDVIVIYSDNCPGLKFQSDLGSVKKLPEGRDYGLYYHLALHIGNHRVEIVTPRRTWEIFNDAQQKGVKEMLIVNVSNVRNLLFTIAATGEMSRQMEGFHFLEYTKRWTQDRFGPAADKVRRVIRLYFAGLECEYSRDTSSSYGSKFPRAPMPMFNDGIAFALLDSMLGGKLYWRRMATADEDPVTAYTADPDEVVDRSKARCPDQYAIFAWRSRTGPRAAAEVAGMQRCLDAIEAASEELTPVQRDMLFQRFGYQAEFSLLVCKCLSELSLAEDARRGGAKSAEKRHLQAALEASIQRDALDRRYASGVWQHWHDRDLIYPYSKITDRIRKLLRPANGK